MCCSFFLQTVEVDVEDNALIYLPNSLFGMPKLNILRIGHNKIKQIPLAVGGLTGLEVGLRAFFRPLFSFSLPLFLSLLRTQVPSPAQLSWVGLYIFLSIFLFSHKQSYNFTYNHTRMHTRILRAHLHARPHMHARRKRMY